MARSALLAFSGALLLGACSDEYPHSEVRAASFPAWLDAGPMLGHVSSDEVRLWYQVHIGADSARTAADVRAELQVGDRPFVAADEVREFEQGCRVAIFRGVAGDNFTARVKSGDEERDVHGRLAPMPSNTGHVVLAFGSCSRDSEFGRTPVFARIPEHDPDVMLFAGDNSYFIRGGTGPNRYSTTTKEGDWETLEKMLARHLQSRRLPSLQKLISTTPCYAIWDDHDYGPNDADRDYPGKDRALAAFDSMWANPDRPEGAPEGGCISTFRRGPIEVWMLDGRWFKKTRDANKKLLPNATIWGADQIAWLERTLLASTAPVKVIVSGTQIFERGFVGEGHWQEAKEERARFESFLRDNRIDGVIVLSGDRHHHELMRVGPVEGAYVYEFTSSPFQYGQKVGPIPKERSNPTRLWGTRGNGFGLVTIDVRGERDGDLRFEVFGENDKVPNDGDTPCSRTITLGDLYYDK